MAAFLFMTFLDKLLDYYNISYQDYENLKREVSLADIPSYKVFERIEEARTLIFNATKEKQKILIYGDYDADGVLATSILVRAFKKMNYEVSYYIPSRYLDGYGITSEKVELAKKDGYSLIITVDNGITAFDAIKKAKEIGINMLITDHHEFNEEITDFIYLHPKKSSLKSMTSGATVAFYLSYALLGEIDPYLISLAATSILSDVMPMKNENRQIMRLALKYLNKYHFDKFNLLSEQLTYDESTLALKVIPKINAVGRIEEKKEVNILVKYFTTDNYRDLVQIREYLNQTNEKRKNLTIDAVNQLVVTPDAGIVLNLDILSGLTGLIANRLLYKYNVPVCVFANEIKNGTIRGSIRSKHGFDVIMFMKENADLFVERGGHECAGGIVIKSEDLNKFKTAFLLFANKHPFVAKADNIPITLDEITMTNYDLIRTFSPFGNEWKEPLFVIKDVPVKLINRIGPIGQHLSILLDNKSKVIGFNYPFDTLTSEKIDLIGKFNLNKYKNNVTLNFTLEN